MPQTTVTRTSAVGTYPGGVTKTSISTVQEGPLPLGYSGSSPNMLPSHSNMIPSLQRNGQAYADPMVGQMYNNTGGFNSLEMGALNNYNSAQTGINNAYNGAQNTTRNAYNNIQTGVRDSSRDAAASVGAPRNLSP
jgi:hypothetical protein